MKKLTTFLSVSIIFFANTVFAQNDIPKKPDWAYKHNELPDDKYIPSTGETKTSPPYTFRKSNFFATQVNVDVNGYNILGDAANEPSLAIDPSNTNRMVIGWRQFNTVTSNFRQAGYGYSTNGGNSWLFPGVINPGVFRSDPVLDCDATGRFFYNSLTAAGNDYTCDVFRNVGSTFVWDAGVDAQGGDKQWMVIDKSNSSGAGHIYSNWNWYYSICTPNDFTRSVDHGASFEGCRAVEGQTHWGTLAVGPDGELYTIGANNAGDVVLSKSTTAKNSSVPVTWDFTSIVYLDGMVTSGIDVNPLGLLGQCYVDVDRSSGPGHGNVYVCASVERFSGDPGDVMFSKSTNGGQDWLYAPIRINDDAGSTSFQWFGTMSVAPNGRIDIVWLDTRDTPAGPIQSALYYSFSTNQGNSWSPNEKLSNYFDSHVGWPDQEKMGDYFHMISYDNAAHLAWTGTFNGEEDVYYGRITPVLGTDNVAANDNIVMLNNYPNPFKDQSTITYTIPEKCNVKLIISDVFGKEIKTLVNKVEEVGSHQVLFETNNLSAGIYYCKITAGSYVESRKIVILK